MTNAILCKLCKRYCVKNIGWGGWAVRAHVTLCMPMLRAFVDMWALVLMTSFHCDEGSMTLWPILLQHNPFLTMLVDPNGLTQDGWCERDVVPRHKYRPHWHMLPTEIGLFLLGMFREHSVTGLHYVKSHIYHGLLFLLSLVFLVLLCHPTIGWIGHLS